MGPGQSSSDAVEWRPEEGVYRTHFGEERDAPSFALVEAVAALGEADPGTTEPIGRTVDLDALDTVVQSSSDESDVRVQLPCQGYRATVYGDGRIELRPVSSDAASPGTST